MTGLGTASDFNRGDRVVHSRFGVGRIASVEEMEYNGEAPGLYYRVEFDKTSLWVPVQAPGPGKLRPVTSKGELARYRSLLKSPPVGMTGDFRARQGDLEKRMQLGTFQSVCELVRDLSARKAQKNISSYERGLLNQLHSALVEEWSAASGQSPADVSGEIEEFLQKGRLSDDART